jgi:hypothetical protein
MDMKKVKELMAMPKEERQKLIKEFWTEENLKELENIGKGIVLGKNSAYDFLFTGKNNEYDDEYKGFIEETEENGKMYNEQDMDSLKGVLRQFINSNGGNIDFGIAEESDIKAVIWAIEQIEKLEKENDRLRNKNNKLIHQMGTAFENDDL